MLNRNLVIATLILAAATAAWAQSNADIKINPAAGRRLTRSEVLADLEIYRLSGLQNFAPRESEFWGIPAYEAAKKRYEELRQSPKYTELVRTIAIRRGELQLLAQKPAASLAVGE